MERLILAEWRDGRNRYLPTSFMVHADDDDTDTFKSFIVQADWACGSSAHGQTDSQLFSTLLSHVMYWQVCLYVRTYCYVDVCIRVG